MKKTFRIPGIRKYGLIENTLASKTILTMGPSSESVKTKANVLSMTPKSFENMLLRRPVGVISK